MKTLVLALALCHHYSHWAYPYPQRCTIHAQKTYARVAVTEQTKPRWEQPANIPDIPVLLSEEAQRAAAIVQLKNAH